MFCQRCHIETKDLHSKVPVCEVCQTLILLEWHIRHLDMEQELTGYMNLNSRAGLDRPALQGWLFGELEEAYN